MHHLLRRLTGISALVLIGAISGLSQNQASQPAQSGTAAPAAKKKEYKDQQEYTLYDSASKETDANKKLTILNTWKEKYPESDFKVERLELMLATYQQLNQFNKVVDTAKEILAVDPKNIRALYWITLLTPQLNLNSADALDTADKAANGLLNAEAPAGTKPEDWEKTKKVTDAIAYKTLGWIGLQRKNYDVAEQNLVKSLKVEPNQGEADYWLGMTIYGQKKPERMPELLFYFARAAAYDGPGSMPAQQRQQADNYLTKVYTAYHGDTSGLAELKTLAKANPLPPPDLKLKSAAETSAEKEEELKKTNPELALWMNIKGQLLAPDGQQYFDSSMKGAQVPKLKGWIVGAVPATHSKELKVSMEGKDQPADVTLKLVGSDGTTAAPLAGKPEIGTEIEFEGVGDSLAKDPLMVTFNVEKSKITGLKEEKTAPVRRPVHKKG